MNEAHSTAQNRPLARSIRKCIRSLVVADFNRINDSVFWSDAAKFFTCK